ncbi:heme utilization protein HutZ [Pasteurella testudinis]|uniref:heme utilization protein HutZ n=1 Tax=Pasteurella testudinis TaxID=761 RepID=UPI00405871E7
MDDRQQRLQNRLGSEIQELKQRCRTLMLATVDEEGKPNVSYAPFVSNEKGYYVFISDIARHARNLKRNNQVSLMLIEDEADSRQIFARRRLSFDAKSEIISHDSAEWHHGTAALLERHGKIVENLTEMKDFTLFNLIPQQGLFVKGFGQAFRVGADDLIGAIHLQQGHSIRENTEHQGIIR